MKEKILQIIDSQGLTPSKLADILDVQRSNISHILAGRNKPSLDFLQKIMTAFPDISGDWLLAGKGEMYRENFDTGINQPIPNSEAGLFAVENSPPATYRTPSRDVVNKISNPQAAAPDKTKSIKKIVLIYDDFSVQEFTPD